LELGDLRPIDRWHPEPFNDFGGSHVEAKTTEIFSLRPRRVSHYLENRLFA
jgi:hypothetical protein